MEQIPPHLLQQPLGLQPRDPTPPTPPPPPPHPDQLSEVRAAAATLATASLQGDSSHQFSVPTSQSQPSGRKNTLSTSSTRLTKSSKRRDKPKKSTKPQQVAVESDCESDDNTVFDQPNLGLGHEGYNLASLLANPSGAQSYIPCRFADKGCQEVFSELLLADIHARTFHGEAPTHHRQQVRQPVTQTQPLPSQASAHTPPSVSCSVCAATFLSSQEMLTHVFSSHPREAEQLRRSYGVPSPVSPGAHHHQVHHTWPGQTNTPSAVQVKCVLCKALLPSEQALVDHLNLTHGLPGGVRQPSQSFHAPAPYPQPPGNSVPGLHGGSQLDQLTELLTRLLPSLSHQPHPPPAHSHQPVLTPHQPQVGPQQPFTSRNPLAPQLPQQSQLPSALPVGFHAASLFPTSHPKCSSDSKLKSGLDRTVAPTAAVYVLWPHEAFDRVSGQRDFKHYGDLSVGALAAGMVRSLLYLPEFTFIPTSMQMQLQNMSTLFHSIVAKIT